MIFAAINDKQGNNTPYFKNSKGEVFKFVGGIFSKEPIVKKVGNVTPLKLPKDFDHTVYNKFLSPFHGHIEGNIIEI